MLELGPGGSADAPGAHPRWDVQCCGLTAEVAGAAMTHGGGTDEAAQTVAQPAVHEERDGGSSGGEREIPEPGSPQGGEAQERDPASAPAASEAPCRADSPDRAPAGRSPMQSGSAEHEGPAAAVPDEEGPESVRGSWEPVGWASPQGERSPPSRQSALSSPGASGKPPQLSQGSASFVAVRCSVERALNLRGGGSGAAAAAAFCVYEWPVTGETRSTPIAPLAPGSGSADWLHTCRLPLWRTMPQPRDEGATTLLFQVYLRRGVGEPAQPPHFSLDGLESSDVLIGTAALDFSLLWFGLDQVEGWYNILDVRHRPVGQIKVSLHPMEPPQRAFLCDTAAQEADADLLPAPARDGSPEEACASSRSEPCWATPGTAAAEDNFTQDGMSRSFAAAPPAGSPDGDLAAALRSRLQELEELTTAFSTRLTLPEEGRRGEVASAEDRAGSNQPVWQTALQAEADEPMTEPGSGLRDNQTPEAEEHGAAAWAPAEAHGVPDGVLRGVGDGGSPRMSPVLPSEGVGAAPLDRTFGSGGCGGPCDGIGLGAPQPGTGGADTDESPVAALEPRSPSVPGEREGQKRGAGTSPPVVQISSRTCETRGVGGGELPDDPGSRVGEPRCVVREGTVAPEHETRSSAEGLSSTSGALQGARARSPSRRDRGGSDEREGECDCRAAWSPPPEASMPAPEDSNVGSGPPSSRGKLVSPAHGEGVADSSGREGLEPQGALEPTGTRDAPESGRGAGAKTGEGSLGEGDAPADRGGARERSPDPLSQGRVGAPPAISGPSIDARAGPPAGAPAAGHGHPAGVWLPPSFPVQASTVRFTLSGEAEVTPTRSGVPWRPSRYRVASDDVTFTAPPHQHGYWAQRRPASAAGARATAQRPAAPRHRGKYADPEADRIARIMGSRQG
uniref:C2 domain-containing protein n=1 Tax=Tetraselmis sp. GSL018 TaxID=582737 RepID=A0A061SD46_9CHLO